MIPTLAAAAWFSIIIRCEQSSDTCVKREIRHPSEAACDAANQNTVDMIGKTNDIVIAFCAEDGK